MSDWKSTRTLSSNAEEDLDHPPEDDDLAHFELCSKMPHSESLSLARNNNGCPQPPEADDDSPLWRKGFEASNPIEIDDDEDHKPVGRKRSRSVLEEQDDSPMSEERDSTRNVTDLTGDDRTPSMHSESEESMEPNHSPDCNNERLVDLTLDDASASETSTTEDVCGDPSKRRASHEVASKSLKKPFTIDLSSDDLSGKIPSTVRNQEERIESFLEGVHGFSVPNQTSSKEEGVEVIDCTEGSENDSDEDDQKHASGTNERPKTTAKPRFKPHKGKKTEASSNHRKTRNHRVHVESQFHATAFVDQDTKNYASHSSFRASEKAEQAEEYRFIFHKSSFRPQDRYSIDMTFEDAEKEQERLFQKAAERLRTHASFRVESERTSTLVSFSDVVKDIHVRHSEHWKFRDSYARLGLPRNASETMIKSQYRRLARVYHPDRNIGKPSTKHKFQAVTEAYESLMMKS